MPPRLRLIRSRPVASQGDHDLVVESLESAVKSLCRAAGGDAHPAETETMLRRLTDQLALGYNACAISKLGLGAFALCCAVA